MDRPWLRIIGLAKDGLTGLPSASREAIARAGMGVCDMSNCRAQAGDGRGKCCSVARNAARKKVAWHQWPRLRIIGLGEDGLTGLQGASREAIARAGMGVCNMSNRRAEAGGLGRHADLAAAQQKDACHG